MIETGEKLRVLYVEDNPVDVDLITRDLARQAPAVSLVSVPTLAAAQERLAGGAAPFDVVLVDLKLPDGRGLDLVAHIREQRLPLAVVVITGSGDQETAVAALRAGADDYLVKRRANTEAVVASLHSARQRFNQRRSRQSIPVRVLYAEPNPFDVDLTRQHLARYAPNVLLRAVHDGEAVFRALREATISAAPGFDVLLLDYQLPGLNALEVVKMLREEQQSDLPIVMVTGHGCEDVAIQALRLGVDDYLIKQGHYLDQLPATLEKIQMQAELRRSEARHRVLFENNPHPMWVCDPQSRAILTVNDAALAQYGYSRAELLAMKDYELETTEFMPCADSAADWMAAGRIPSSLRRHKTRSDDIVDVELFRHELNFDGRRCDLVLALDVTRRVEAEMKLAESIRDFKAIFEQAAVGIARVAPDGRWLQVNRKLSEIIGYTEAELLSRTFQDITHPDDLDTNLDQVQQILTGKVSTYAMEKRYIRKDGGIVWVNLTVGLVRTPENEPAYFISVVEDISARKQMEVERQQLIGQLEKRNLELEKYTYSASHDLKTPVVTILLYLGQLAEDLDRQDMDNVRADLDYISTAANKMMSLLASLLKLARAGQMVEEPQPIDLAGLVEEAVSQFRLQDPRTQLDKHLPPGLPAIKGDPVRLLQVFQSLLENAGKFMGVKAEPKIEIRCREEDGQVVCAVKDNGIGIPVRYLDRVFGLFEKLDAGSAGDGVGLSLVKRIVSEHGGRVWAESGGEGEGSTFYVSLPAADRADQ